jgi:hypothetical protein
MNDYLRLTFSTDGDGTGELSAEASCNGFAGHSSAWFGISRLEQFADLILTYPLPADGLAPLRGGYWSKERHGELDDLHLGLHFYPIGLRGTAGCKVQLPTPDRRGNVPVSLNSVDVELRTSYQELSDFSAGFRRLIRGELGEVVLRGGTV